MHVLNVLWRLDMNYSKNIKCCGVSLAFCCSWCCVVSFLGWLVVGNLYGSWKATDERTWLTRYLMPTPQQHAKGERCAAYKNGPSWKELKACIQIINFCKDMTRQKRGNRMARMYQGAGVWVQAYVCVCVVIFYLYLLKSNTSSMHDELVWNFGS